MSSSTGESKYNKKLILSLSLAALVGCIIFGTVTGLYYLGCGLLANPDSIIIEDIQLLDYEGPILTPNPPKYELLVKGTHKNRHLDKFRVFTRIEGEKMYISLHYTLTSRLNPYHDNLSKDFELTSAQTGMNRMEEIYLEGMNHHKPRLIWSR
ncbi:MAG: hypothetical protein JJT76_08165 [Clostridiaceae bacterium]|nr:hypothetical protein [Clostridiaceae bacterium]